MKGYIHNVSNVYESNPANLVMARSVLKPDGYGNVRQESWVEYWDAVIESVASSNPLSAYKNNAIKVLEISYKYFDYDYESMSLYIRFASLLGVRFNRKYNTPDAIASVVRSAVGFYAANPDILAEARKNIANGSDTTEKVIAVWNPFFVQVAEAFPFSSLAQTFCPNWKAFSDYLGGLKMWMFPQVLYPLKQLNSMTGFPFGQVIVGGGDVVEAAAYINNQILGRLMQPESLGALIAMKRLAKSTTLPNQGTAKLAMFYWHAMMEVKENPNSGWKQSIDDNFKSQFDAIAQARYDPRFMLGRMRLYALCGFTSGDNSPENAAAFYDFVVWFYSFPNNASDLAYFKTIVQSDSSPGQISSFYDMMADMRVKLLPFFGNTGTVWKTGSALAATTPHEFLQAGVFEHLQTPVVQAAIERFREFFGIGNLPMATREDIDAWQQSLMETYQKNVMKMHPSLANL
eukprot:g10726.t1